MKATLRITSHLLAQIRNDLRRTHPFAAERVGFLTCRIGSIDNGFVLLGQHWHEVIDDDYINDSSVGAMIGGSAFRKIFQYGYNNRVSILHVHLHDHDGIPNFSSVDQRESSKFVPDFWNVRPDFPHGALVLSNNSLVGKCWYPKRSMPMPISEVRIIGSPIQWVRHD